jgi:hypothetical protein
LPPAIANLPLEVCRDIIDACMANARVPVAARLPLLRMARAGKPPMAPTGSLAMQSSIERLGVGGPR